MCFAVDARAIYTLFVLGHVYVISSTLRMFMTKMIKLILRLNQRRDYPRTQTQHRRDTDVRVHAHATVRLHLRVSTI